MKLQSISTRAGLLAAAIVAAAGLAACSSGGGGADTAAQTTLDHILTSKTITVGVKADTPPYGFVPQGQSEPAGFDIDLTREIASRLGVEVEMIEVTSANRIANLTTGKVDLLVASLVHTRERDKTIDYSITYFADAQKMLVPEGSAIESVADLAGKRVAVGQGSIQEQIIKAVAPEARVLSMAKWSDTLQSLRTNQADAIFSAAGVLDGLRTSAAEAGMNLTMVGEEGLAPIPYAIGFRQGDSDLRDEVNRVLMEIVEDGTYETIFNEWWSGVYSEPYRVEVWPV